MISSSIRYTVAVVLFLFALLCGLASCERNRPPQLSNDSSAQSDSPVNPDLDVNPTVASPMVDVDRTDVLTPVDADDLTITASADAWHLTVNADGHATLTISTFPDEIDYEFLVTRSQLRSLQRKLTDEGYFDLSREYGLSRLDDVDRKVCIATKDRKKAIVIHSLMDVDQSNREGYLRAERVFDMIRSWIGPALEYFRHQ